jgi:DNA-binding response OmpR family regulator
MNRILVVDDEPSILHGLVLGLSSKENVVDCASEGEAAIKKGCEEKYDVLIVDLCLPDMHGFNVLRKLKEQNPQLILIIITAQRSKESVAEARRLGVNDYFEKPFHIHSIKDAIARGIAQRAATGSL